jgi:aspartate/methionine/tyrosine aminotransferase
MQREYFFAQRLDDIALSQLALRRLQAEGKGWSNLISMAGAEPAFAPPPGVEVAFAEVVERGYTNYSPVSGYRDFIGLIQAKLKRNNDIEVACEQILCAPGAAAALHVLLTALVDPGDEVLIQDPCWDHYPNMIRLLGGRPKRFRMVNDENGHFAPDTEHLKSLVSPKTRVILVNTPLNPCGAVLTREEIASVIEIADSNGLVLISDEAYESFIYGDREHISPASLSENAVTIHSFSKGFAVPGVRLAYISGPKTIIETARTVSLYSFLLTSSPAQYIGAAILRSDYETYTYQLREFCQSRMKSLHRRLNEVAGIRCGEPEGGLYLTPVLEIPGMTSEDVADRLFHEQHVISMPGGFCGRQLNDRLCLFYVLEEPVLAEAARRISEAVMRWTDVLLRERGTAN